MTLSSIQLEAFYAVARTLSFSKAAKDLHITQSALSQRVLNLEDQLRSKLFIRAASGVRCTESGNILLRYCRNQKLLEHESLSQLSAMANGNKQSLEGQIRIGGYSTVMRSIVLERLSDLVRNSNIQLEAHVLELSDLPKALHSGLIDYMVLDRSLGNTGRYDTQIIGFEENILVESTQIGADKKNTYLDHDPGDQTTFHFFKWNNQSTKKFQRSYLDDIYGIIDAVEKGLGRAVVPMHLIQQKKNIRLVAKFKPMKTPIVLHYYRRPYYGTLHQQVLDSLLVR